jgi:hypothetical protein
MRYLEKPGITGSTLLISNSAMPLLFGISITNQAIEEVVSEATLNRRIEQGTVKE